MYILEVSSEFLHTDVMNNIAIRKKNHLIVNEIFLHSLNSLKTTQSVGSKYLEIFMQGSHLRRTDFPINGHFFILKVVTQTCHSLFIGQNIFIYVHIETEVF